MQYSPQSEREIRDSMMLEPGEYDFEVVEGKDTISKASGNEMIALKIRIFPNDQSSPRLINDYLVPGSKMGELKINRFCHATGLQDVYFAGDLTGFACSGATGKLKLTVTSSEQYGDQNAVRDYIVNKSNDDTAQAPPARSARKANDELAEEYEKELANKSDDIPF